MSRNGHERNRANCFDIGSCDTGGTSQKGHGSRPKMTPKSLGSHRRTAPEKQVAGPDAGRKTAKGLVEPRKKRDSIAILKAACCGR